MSQKWRIPWIPRPRRISIFSQREDIEVLGGVFICYRREDSGGYAGRIYDRLAKRLGRTNVFIDVDNIPPGLDFVDVLSERVGACTALIAIIGRDWVSIADKENRRRIDDPHDFVHIEIAAALDRGISAYTSSLSRMRRCREPRICRTA